MKVERSPEDMSSGTVSSLNGSEGISSDLNGDGKIDPWERNLCRYCLFAALALAFGEKFVGLI